MLVRSQRGLGSQTGSIIIRKANGSVKVFKPAANTSLARGVSLVAACAQTLAGDILEIGPGTFDTADQPLIFANGASFLGAGVRATTVTSVVGGLSRCFIKPGSDSFISGFRIVLPVDDFAHAPIGVRGTQTPFVNVEISDLELVGGSDGFNIAPGVGGGTFSARLQNVVCETCYDNFIVNSADANVTAANCKFRTSGLSPFGEEEEEGNTAVVTAAGAIVKMIACEIEVVESDAGPAIAVRALSGSSLSLHGCTVTGDGAVDIVNSSSTIRATATRFDPLKATGTILTE